MKKTCVQVILSIVSVFFLALDMLGVGGPVTSVNAQKISDLGSFTDTLDDSDVIPMVDISDTGVSSSGTTKKITASKWHEYEGAAYPKTAATLVAAVANANTPVVVLAADVTLSAPLTIPAGKTYSALPGAVLTTSAVNTLTFATGSHLEDNGWQMFDSLSGEVVGLSLSTPRMFGGVSDYNIGTGAGTDNASALNSAIAALQTGGVLSVTEGNYKADSKITGKSNITISGKGVIYYTYEQLVGDALGQAGCITFPDDTTDVSISGISLVYTGTFSPGTSYDGKICGINFTSASNVTIDNVDISGFNHSGVYVNGTTDPGYRVNFNLTNSRLHGNRVSGAWVTSLDGGLVENNRCYENGLITDFGTGYGIAVTYGDANYINRKVHVSKNKCYDNQRTGIVVKIFTDITVSENEVYNTAPDGAGMRQFRGIVLEEPYGKAIVASNKLHGFRDLGQSAAYLVEGISFGYPGQIVDTDAWLTAHGNELWDFSVTGGSQLGYPINWYPTRKRNLVSITNNKIEALNCYTGIKATLPAAATNAVTYAKAILSDNQLMLGTVDYRIIYLEGQTDINGSKNQISVTTCTDATQSIFSMTQAIATTGPTVYHDPSNRLIAAGNLCTVPAGWAAPVIMYPDWPGLFVSNSINAVPYGHRVSGVTATVADGGTITHTFGTTPSWTSVTPSVSGEFVSVTAIGATTFTVAIKKHDNSAGTTQTLYWTVGR